MIDLAIIGGGINGIGIARDAAGRGVAVTVLERGDLGGATSSASSKLVHGGLRYLEQGSFRLVRESLAEREVLLAAAPHLIEPLRFVLPVHAGLRPPWMLRLGLFLYDHIGGRRLLPPARSLRRGRDAQLAPLRESYRRAFEYSDCWADDARLVIANAVDARRRGAHIEVGWACVRARRDAGCWVVEARSSSGEMRTLRARVLVNAAGPWVEEVLSLSGEGARGKGVRLVKGSHIVVPRLYEGAQAYTFQSGDGRVVFAVPFQEDFTLIGTTDVPFEGDARSVRADADEVAYLCETVAGYFRTPVVPSQVLWTYSGVRPLYDDGQVSASTVTRDYVFDLDVPAAGAPLLSVFGGKLTTYRKLAEHALQELAPHLGTARAGWTQGATLPGGDLPQGDLTAFIRSQCARYAALPQPLVRRLCRSYGTRIEEILGATGEPASLGEEIGPLLYEAELRFLKDEEWARSADDVLWRRSKLGLRTRPAQFARIEEWLAGSGG